MRVFITGGSGFLGKASIRRLVASGHEVFALARSQKAQAAVEGLGARAIQGDLQFIESLRSRLEEFDVVVHCAAPVKFWGPWEEFDDGITRTTMRLARLADDSGVKRFVHISSESVLQDKGSLLDIDESYPYPDKPNSHYGTAKKLAEQRLLESTFKMDVVILRPTFIWGEECPALFAIEEKVRSQKFVWIDRGNSAFEAVHVENVAHAIVLSLSAGKNKGVYFITDQEPATVRDFFDRFFETRKLRAPKLSLPGSVARPMASASEALWRFLNLRMAPPLTRFDLAFVSQPRRYVTFKAATELGYEPVISREAAWKKWGRT